MNRLAFSPLAFSPGFGLSSPHLQTLFAGSLSGGIAPTSTPMYVLLTDGDQLCCEVSAARNRSLDDPTVVLVHGLGGSHESNYMIRMARKLYNKGYKVVRVNLRGCGSGAGLSKRPYNAGTSQDLQALINVLKQQAPSSEISVIGFSLGGSVVLKLAGECGDDAFVKQFIAVSAPLDLHATVKLIQAPRHYLYHRYYLNKMCRQAKEWLKSPVQSIYDFDNVVTAPLWGYESADEYYEKVSGIHYIPKICRPCYLLMAEDDPFVSLEPLTRCRFSLSTKVFVTSHGGHMGFLAKGCSAPDSHWLDDQLIQWLDNDRI